MNQRLILATAFALATPAAFCQAPAATAPPAPDAQQQGPPPQKRHFEMRIEREGNEPLPRQMIVERREFMGGPEGEEGGMPMRMKQHREMGMDHEHGKHGDWWKNPEVARNLALTPEQIKKLDELSVQGKLNMIHLHATLEEQEVLMKPIMESATLDQKKADLQIDKVAEARAAVEKAGAKQKLAMRAVLTPDQWTKMHEHHLMGGPQQGPGGMMQHHHMGGPEGGPQHAEGPMMEPSAPPAE